MIHPGNLHWTGAGYVNNSLDCCGGWCNASVICKPLLAERSRIASERSQGKCGSRQRVEKKSILTEKKSQENKMSRERDTKDKMFQDLSREADAKRTKGRGHVLQNCPQELPKARMSLWERRQLKKFPTEGDVKGIRWQES